MYTQNNGYRHGVEKLATHARCRYRLLPPQVPNSNAPPIDPCLWIVHYFQMEPRKQILVGNIPLSDHTRQLAMERAALQSHGQLQLQHNEFMLHDRNNWPSIISSGSTAAPYTQQTMGYPNNVMAQMGRNQHPAAMQDQQAVISQGSPGPSPSKRPRHVSTNPGHISSTALATHLAARDIVDEDDEALTNLDYMDVMTPREISALRYVQHHEWLEEILNSPYDTHQIIPGELGLGRKGELESLTRDFFHAHTSQTIGTVLEPPSSPRKGDYEAGRAVVPNDAPPRVGRMANGRAADFGKKADEKMDQLRVEMETMKMKHARRVEKLKNVQIWKEADQELRTNTTSLINGKLSVADAKRSEAAVQEWERRLEKEIRPLQAFECLAKGGLEDKGSSELKIVFVTPDSESQDGSEEEDHTNDEERSEPQEPVEMVPPHAGASPRPLSDQQASEQGDTSASTGPHFETNVESASIAGNKGTDDWIMVDKASDGTDHDEEQNAFDGFANDSTMHLDDKPEDPVVGDQDNEPEDMTFGDTDFDAGLEFSDFNTAGPELSNYAQEIESMGVGNEQAVGVEDGDQHGSAQVIDKDGMP